MTHFEALVLDVEVGVLAVAALLSMLRGLLKR